MERRNLQPQTIACKDAECDRPNRPFLVAQINNLQRKIFISLFFKIAVNKNPCRVYCKSEIESCKLKNFGYRRFFFFLVTFSSLKISTFLFHAPILTFEHQIHNAPIYIYIYIFKEFKLTGYFKKINQLGPISSTYYTNSLAEDLDLAL